MAEKERKNFWTKKRVEETMDDARESNINELLNATKEYMNKGNIFENRYEHYGTVQDEIKQFILENTSPRVRYAKT